VANSADDWQVPDDGQYCQEDHVVGDAHGEVVDPHARESTRSRRGETFELRCSSCGYGVVVRIAPEACPMCLGTVWEHPRRASDVGRTNLSERQG
jgi:hypothetical protein